MQNKGKLANNIFFLSLLAIFVLCSVIVVSYQISGYQSIILSNEIVDEEHTPLAYLSNKLRSADSANAVYISEINHQNVLVLENKDIKTYIYMHEHKLMELQSTSSYELKLDDGNALFEITSLRMKQDDNHLIFQIGINDEVKTLIISLHSKGGSL